MTKAEEIEMGLMYKAIAQNKWSAAKAYLESNPRILSVEFGATMDETPLHVAAKFGHVGIVEELVRLVEPQYLDILDARGHTPLLIAASHSGIIPIAKCLIEKNSNALAIPDKINKWAIPVTVAFFAGLKEMGRYLYSVTPLHVLKPENGHLGLSFLRTCCVSGEFDIVLDLLLRYPELLFATDHSVATIIQLLAISDPNIPNKSQLPFWKRVAYHYIKIPSITTGHSCINTQKEGRSNKADKGMKEIHKMKLQHARAAEILNLICENMMVLDRVKKEIIAQALIAAARTGNVEFVLHVTKANLELISLITSPDQGLPFFFDAVAYRRAEIFNLLRGFRFKHVVATFISPDDSNSLLHVAAMLAPASYLNHISGAPLQLQRELQWFKEVESVVDPGTRLCKNNEGLTPLEFFKEKHKELRDKGEIWMKETASSCSVAGALIVTIMFAAAFTVPGGNNQTTGYPMFMEEKLFKVFLISDVLSLFSSTTSVLTFLGILSSRYAEEDFLYSLPTKLIIMLSTLFLSIATMMIAFSATIMIMLQNNSPHLWILLPIIVLASVPATLFVVLQFPLLVEILSSTYGTSIFKKKVEIWP